MLCGSFAGSSSRHATWSVATSLRARGSRSWLTTSSQHHRTIGNGSPAYGSRHGPWTASHSQSALKHHRYLVLPCSAKAG